MPFRHEIVPDPKAAEHQPGIRRDALPDTLGVVIAGFDDQDIADALVVERQCRGAAGRAAANYGDGPVMVGCHAFPAINGMQPAVRAQLVPFSFIGQGVDVQIGQALQFALHFKELGRVLRPPTIAVSWITKPILSQFSRILLDLLIAALVRRIAAGGTRTTDGIALRAGLPIRP